MGIEMVDSVGASERCIHEECGVFGVMVHDGCYSGKPIGDIAFTGLHYLQHRGEESAGVVVADGNRAYPPFKEMGHVRDVYRKYPNKDKPDGHIAIAHTRYSTTGSSVRENAAPFLFEGIAVAHNGNITNAAELKAGLIEQGAAFSSTTDSEVIAALIARTEGASWHEKITKALQRLTGSFSLVMCTADALWAARDPMGNRPLFLAEAQMNGVRGTAIASESPAFAGYQLQQIIEVPRGKLIKVTDRGGEEYPFGTTTEESLCALETAYLMRPDSYLGDVQMYQIRRHFGSVLARLYPPPSDIEFVSYIPESARSTAEGFAEALSEQFGRFVSVRTVMIKGRYGTLNGAMRGFINPDTRERGNVVATNYFVFDEAVRGKIFAMIDDSVIRGTTTKGVMKLLGLHGARGIHLRIPFPPVVSACPLGTDISDNDWLVAREYRGVERIAGYLGVDTLAYLTPEQFQHAVDEVLGNHRGLCLGCATGKYPVDDFQANKLVFEL